MKKFTKEHKNKIKKSLKRHFKTKEGKFQLKKLKGKNSRFYINGITLKKYYCKDCGRELPKGAYQGTKRCIQCFNIYRIGENASSYIHGDCLKKAYCIDCGKELSRQAYYYGYKRCKNCAGRERFIKSLQKSSSLPNKSEKLLRKILNRILPKEYKYVGNFDFWIETFNPDFINCNGQKKIIELYGFYWHNNKKAIKRDKKRIKIYTQYGYKTLIIWERELKDIEKVSNKVLIFNSK